ncbi:hypothetical protein HBH70_187910 [Parastagonospora nodorum]|nr:hypothetical protein HBI95_197130 [Parastagonospora nodorum]KAH4952725.1 hypothetical protein HBI78_236330 [Parastagonospora nodorum]KAH5130727.1 hypothetical protein HBH70_187910 [Parastagonospora nodorum]KAH5147841.1 hypothetical protein HBH69_166570 [Parastagonospora nodorum]KAH5173601.1 hypothetical protein HBH77_208420 [Parastagonospora nodorum]
MDVVENSDFLVDLDFPDNGYERGFWSSPVNDILYQMKGIFKAFPNDHWFTYIGKLLTLLDHECANEQAYDRLEDLTKQHTSLVSFHRLLVEEFVPGLVKTFTPDLAKAYPWHAVTSDLAEQFIGFSCQREREVDKGGHKDETEQRQYAASFIDAELATRDGKAFVEKQSHEDQDRLIALLEGLAINPARADAAALARDSDLYDLADGFADTMQLD